MCERAHGEWRFGTLRPPHISQEGQRGHFLLKLVLWEKEKAAGSVFVKGKHALATMLALLANLGGTNENCVGFILALQVFHV